MSGMIATTGISSIMSMFGSSKGGMTFAIGAAAAIGWAMYLFEASAFSSYKDDAVAKFERFEANETKLKSTIDAKDEAIKTLNDTALENYKLKLKDDFDAQVLRDKLADTEERFKSYEKRWNKVANARPESLARLANRAWLKRMQRIEAATCRTNCGKREDSGNSTQSGAASNEGSN